MLLKAWMMLRYNPSERSIFARTNKSGGSRRLTIDDFKTQKHDMSAERLGELLREELFEIVRSYTKKIGSDAQIGVLLSGGIDSTSLLAILLELGFEPKAVTIGFGEESDEIQSAQTVARSLGVPHAWRIADGLLDSTSDANSLLEEPYRGACIYYEAVKLAKEVGITHLFDGLGVDEFYGGYGFRYEKVEHLLKNGFDRIQSYVRGAHPCDYTDDESMFGPRLRDVRVDWNALFPYFGDNGLPLIDQVMLADYNSKCRQNFIPLSCHGDQLGVRIHYPWLANRFIEFALRVPAELKYDSNSRVTKILFRKAVQDLVPSETMTKRKQGFGPSPKKVHDRLRALAEKKIPMGKLISSGYLNGDYYEKLLANHTPSDVEINKLWDAYTLETFLEQKEVK
jgi:asparagine synthase (glutamine-hydrolysing)